MYQFEDQINWDSFFVFDREWIKNMSWAGFSTGSKTVYPVVACHCSEKDLASPSERRIAILSDRFDKVVRKGIKDLDGFPGFKIDIEKGSETFSFYCCIIYGGNWSQLTPSACALYPVMRCFGTVGMEAERSEFDFCKTDPDILTEHAGISQRSISAALNSLKVARLVEEISRGTRKVFSISPQYVKRAVSNKQILDRYTHERKGGKNDR